MKSHTDIDVALGRIFLVNDDLLSLVDHIDSHLGYELHVGILLVVFKTVQDNRR